MDKTPVTKSILIQMDENNIISVSLENIGNEINFLGMMESAKRHGLDVIDDIVDTPEVRYSFEDNSGKVNPERNEKDAKKPEGPSDADPYAGMPPNIAALFRSMQNDATVRGDQGQSCFSISLIPLPFSR